MSVSDTQLHPNNGEPMNRLDNALTQFYTGLDADQIEISNDDFSGGRDIFHDPKGMEASRVEQDKSVDSSYGHVTEPRAKALVHDNMGGMDEEDIEELLESVMGPCGQSRDPKEGQHLLVGTDELTNPLSEDGQSINDNIEAQFGGQPQRGPVQEKLPSPVMVSESVETPIMSDFTKALAQSRIKTLNESVGLPELVVLLEAISSARKTDLLGLLSRREMILEAISGAKPQVTTLLESVQVSDEQKPVVAKALQNEINSRVSQARLSILNESAERVRVSVKQHELVAKKLLSESIEKAKTAFIAESTVYLMESEKAITKNVELSNHLSRALLEHAKLSEKTKVQSSTLLEQDQCADAYASMISTLLESIEEKEVAAKAAITATGSAAGKSEGKPSDIQPEDLKPTDAPASDQLPENAPVPGGSVVEPSHLPVQDPTVANNGGDNPVIQPDAKPANGAADAAIADADKKPESEPASKPQADAVGGEKPKEVGSATLSDEDAAAKKEKDEEEKKDLTESILNASHLSEIGKDRIRRQADAMDYTSPVKFAKILSESVNAAIFGDKVYLAEGDEPSDHLENPVMSEDEITNFDLAMAALGRGLADFEDDSHNPYVDGDMVTESSDTAGGVITNPETGMPEVGDEN